MAMMVKQEDKQYLKFTVMYKARPEDAIVVMDAAAESLASLYRIIYAMAGKVTHIGGFELCIIHQKLDNGDVIELDKDKFVQVIKETRLDEEARNESAALAAELTRVNAIPPLMETKDTAYDRKFFKVLPITEAGWRTGYESIVR